MKDLSQETIKKIKEKNIHPTTKWKFLVENFFIWISLAFLIIFGAVSLALAYYFLIQLDWDVLRFMHRTSLFFWLVPHIWLLLLVLFFILAFILFRRTKKGYRLEGIIVSSLIFLLFLLVGSAAHYFQADENINNIFSKRVPGYQLLTNNKERQWSQPEAGLLGGEITKVKEKNLNLKDFQGKDWQINYDQNTSIRPSVNLQPNEKIKVIGEKKNDKEFQADEIRPWEGKGMMRGKMKMGN